MPVGRGTRQRFRVGERARRRVMRAPLAAYDWAGVSKQERDARVDALAEQIRQLAALSELPATPAAGRRSYESQIVKLADEIMRVEGWMVYGVPDSRRATSSGFVDRVYCRPPVVLFIEWKLEHGRLHGEQPRWLLALSAVRRTAAAVWRPSHVGDIVKVARSYGR